MKLTLKNIYIHTYIHMLIVMIIHLTRANNNQMETSFHPIKFRFTHSHLQRNSLFFFTHNSDFQHSLFFPSVLVLFRWPHSTNIFRRNIYNGVSVCTSGANFILINLNVFLVFGYCCCCSCYDPPSRLYEFEWYLSNCLRFLCSVFVLIR